MTQLKIGLSACFFHSDPQRPIFKGKTLLYLEESLAHFVMSHDALAYMIPTPPEAGGPTLEVLAAPFDGLVLQGGSDVAPESYGDVPLKPEWSGDRVRDIYEIALLREFGRQNKPVFGICRGAQLINVAFGGTLYQDIPTQVPTADSHRNWELYDRNFHALKFEGGSRLEELYKGQAGGRVNSVHHQAIRHLGSGLLVEARSSHDDMIEAVRAASGPWVYAVQWHPEFQSPDDATLLDSRLILKDFLNEAWKVKRS